MMSSRLLRMPPYLLAAGAAAAFSWSGPVLRLAENAGGAFWAIICIRCSISLIFLYYAAGRTPALTKSLIFRGALLTVQFVLFAEAVTLANPGTVSVLVYTSLLWVPLMAFFLAKEKVSRLDIITSVALLNASAISFLDQLSFKEHLGMFLAIIVGFTWSLGVVLTSRESTQSSSAGADTFLTSGLFIVLVSACFWIYEGSAIPTLTSSAWAAFGGFQSSIALLLFVPALQQLGSTKTNMACSTIDPTCATLWAWLMFGKRPAFWAFLGGACIIGILILHGALLLSQERSRKLLEAESL